jgi:hypothetical protein
MSMAKLSEWLCSHRTRADGIRHLIYKRTRRNEWKVIRLTWHLCEIKNACRAIRSDVRRLKALNLAAEAGVDADIAHMQLGIAAARLLSIEAPFRRIESGD